jgi:mono/diheme cytochrome c family protein
MAFLRLHVLGLSLAGSVFIAPHAMADTRAAADLYQVRCSHCHGSTGQGTRQMVPPLGPALKGNPFVVNGSIAALSSVIRKGRTGQRRLYDDTYGNMIGFGAESVPAVDELSAYLKNELQK